MNFKLNRKLKVLSSLIKLYQNTEQPVSSAEIYSDLEEAISQSSIRHHLQALTREGMLLSLSNNQGKIPADNALQKHAEHSLYSCSNQTYEKYQYKHRSRTLMQGIEDTMQGMAKEQGLTILYSLPSATMLNNRATIKVITSSKDSYITIVDTEIQGVFSVFEKKIKPRWNLHYWDIVKNSCFQIAQLNDMRHNADILQIWKDIAMEVSDALSEKHAASEVVNLGKLAKKIKNYETVAEISDNKDYISRYLKSKFQAGTHVLVGKYFSTPDTSFDNVSAIFHISSTEKEVSFFHAILIPKNKDCKHAIKVCNALAKRIDRMLRKDRNNVILHKQPLHLN